tara:strand:+ start:374 stop:2698 length:2325 start_codon:yes stop_codon:yes gene_type:complete
MKQRATILITIFLIATLPIDATEANEQGSSSTFSISGIVYNTNGELAGSTSIKLSSHDSIWTDDGSYYEYTNVPEGEYSIRAYFMNDGHTVVYRKIIVDRDIELDWTVNKNWITIDTNDELAQFSIINQDEVETESYAELVTFGPYNINNFYTVQAEFGDGQVRDYVVKLRSGSSNEPYVNHLSLNSEQNCMFGFLTDIYENSIPNAVVAIGQQAVYTDDDGFYSMCGFSVGSQYHVTAHSGAIELLNITDLAIENSTGWHNLTSQIIPEKPEAPEFLSQSFDMTITQPAPTITWEGGNYTDHFDLFIDDELAYRGFNENFVFAPTEPGSYTFKLIAVNANGTTEASKTLTVVVLQDAGAGFWNVGMNWMYAIDYYPQSSMGTHNVTMTVVGTESMTDAFGIEQDCYLMKVVDEHDTPDRVRYHWIDTDNLLKIRTYSETSTYFVDGTMGWSYTTSSDETTNLFSSNAEFAHFNRTNIIGVPGHPNGYDDTNNTVTITEDVLVTTPSGTYSTTYYRITDTNDNVDSWELWYNETVRNWVKIIDRLPGSHSESVTYHLADYSGMPSQPQFVTEDSTINTKHYVVEWGPFASATSYDLYRNGVVIYSGDSTSYALENQGDGEYQYQVIAKLFTGSEVASEVININVDFKVPTPELNLPYAQELNSSNELYIEWTKTIDADWYSLQHTSPDGTVTEIYNGSNNFFTFSAFEEGQNRFRASLGYDGGKYSELSNSSYVNYVQQDDDESGKLSFLPLSATILVLLVAVNMKVRRGDGDV